MVKYINENGRHMVEYQKASSVIYTDAEHLVENDDFVEKLTEQQKSELDDNTIGLKAFDKLSTKDKEIILAEKLGV